MNNPIKILFIVTNIGKICDKKTPTVGWGFNINFEKLEGDFDTHIWVSSPTFKTTT
jgi:hypothetical protein